MPAHILDAILAESRGALPALERRRGELERVVADLPPVIPFASALRGSRVAVIAEVKRRSPSLGVIDDAIDPAALAVVYQAGGAAAVSVLTQESRFGGSIADLQAVAGQVRLPLLRKDFIVDEVQLLEARAAGAAAALLIVRAVSPATLRQLITDAQQIGIELLVEAHTADEVAIAVDAGAEVIGVNARDLDTLRIDRTAAWRILAAVPPDVIAVAESGMATRDDVGAAAEAGADAVLIGSALAGSADPGGALQRLCAVERRGR